MEEKALQIFNNPAFGSVRVVEINNEPWFVGVDVATALGYKNPNDAITKHVDSEDKKMGAQNATPAYAVVAQGVDIPSAARAKEYILDMGSSPFYSL